MIPPIKNLLSLVFLIIAFPFLSNAQTQTKTQTKVINVKVYINNATYLVFKKQTPLKINSNAPSTVLLINYDKNNNIISLTPQDKLSDYDSQITVDIATDKQNYHFQLKYNQEYDKQIVFKAPITEKEKQAKKNKLKLEKIERDLFKQLLTYSFKKSENLPLANSNMILFNLKKIINSNNKIYLFTEIENVSNIGYEIEALKVKRAYFKNEKQQSPEVEDVLPYKILDKDYYDYRPLLITTKASIKGVKNKFVVHPQNTEVLVFILNKLTLNKNEHIIVTLFEKNGVRELEADFNNEFINNPTYISPVIKDSKTHKKTTIIKSKKTYSFKKKEFNIEISPLFWANLFEFNVGFWKRIKSSKIAYNGHFFYLQEDFKTAGNQKVVGLDFGFSYRKPILRNLYFDWGLNGDIGFQSLQTINNTNGKIIFGADSHGSLLYRISQKVYLGTTFKIKWLNSTNNLFKKNLIYPMWGLKLNITLN